MDKKRTADGITGGLFLIGLGVLLLTQWWWPGIMVVLGIAVGAGLIFRGRYIPAIAAMVIFFGIPILTTANIPWGVFGPMVLIGIGIIALVKSFYLREG